MCHRFQFSAWSILQLHWLCTARVPSQDPKHAFQRCAESITGQGKPVSTILHNKNTQHCTSSAYTLSIFPWCPGTGIHRASETKSSKGHHINHIAGRGFFIPDIYTGMCVSSHGMFRDKARQHSVTQWGFYSLRASWTLTVSDWAGFSIVLGALIRLRSWAFLHWSADRFRRGYTIWSEMRASDRDCTCRRREAKNIRLLE